MNVSELIFERFCDENGIKFQKVPTQETKTPDYIIELETGLLIVEIKQIDPNPDDRATLNKPPEEWGESDLYSEMPGERVRAKIKSAVPQLRKLANKKYPTLLILYDNVNLWPQLIDPYSIQVAMYGIENILISSKMAPKGGAEILRRWHGSRRKVSPKYNTTLSAVAVIVEENNSINLNIFHNLFAAIPILSKSFKTPKIKHYKPSEEPLGKFPKWIEV